MKKFFLISNTIIVLLFISQLQAFAAYKHVTLSPCSCCSGFLSEFGYQTELPIPKPNSGTSKIKLHILGDFYDLATGVETTARGTSAKILGRGTEEDRSKPIAFGNYQKTGYLDVELSVSSDAAYGTKNLTIKFVAGEDKIKFDILRTGVIDKFSIVNPDARNISNIIQNLNKNFDNQAAISSANNLKKVVINPGTKVDTILFGEKVTAIAKGSQIGNAAIGNVDNEILSYQILSSTENEVKFEFKPNRAGLIDIEIYDKENGMARNNPYSPKPVFFVIDPEGRSRGSGSTTGSRPPAGGIRVGGGSTGTQKPELMAAQPANLFRSVTGDFCNGMSAQSPQKISTWPNLKWGVINVSGVDITQDFTIELWDGGTLLQTVRVNGGIRPSETKLFEFVRPESRICVKVPSTGGCVQCPPGTNGAPELWKDPDVITIRVDTINEIDEDNESNNSQNF